MLGVLFSLRSHGQCRGSVVKQLLRENGERIEELSLISHYRLDSRGKPGQAAGFAP